MGAQVYFGPNFKNKEKFKFEFLRNQIDIGGLKTIPSFQFKYNKYNEKIYTYFTDEMLKEKYLATNSIYISFKHKKNDIEKYLIAVDKVFNKINKIMKDKKKLDNIKTRKFNY